MKVSTDFIKSIQSLTNNIASVVIVSHDQHFVVELEQKAKRWWFTIDSYNLIRDTISSFYIPPIQYQDDDFYMQHQTLDLDDAVVFDQALISDHLNAMQSNQTKTKQVMK